MVNIYLTIYNYKYEKLNSKNQFNIISLLNKTNDEVNLHSKLIATLLDPNENHNLGYEPIKTFLTRIGVKTFKVQDCWIGIEYKNIDILIANKNQAVIIENKISAKDQSRQLQRYYEIIENEGYEDIWIYYLTLDGREPSTQSVGNIDQKIDLISYEFHINEWIESCIEFAARQPSLRESLVQYQAVVKELTGNTMAQEQKDELLELLSQNDNIIRASAIAENWTNVKWQTEWRFWQDLERELSVNHLILDCQKYSKENLDSIYHKSRNRNPWYGLMYEFAQIDNIQVCMFIERGLNDLYYGLTMVENGDRKVSSKENYKKIADDIEGICEWEREELWLGGNYFKPNIDFESFSEKETLVLLNKEKRSIRIKRSLEEIKDFELKCKEKITTHNIVYK